MFSFQENVTALWTWIQRKITVTGTDQHEVVRRVNSSLGGPLSTSSVLDYGKLCRQASAAKQIKLCFHISVFHLKRVFIIKIMKTSWKFKSHRKVSLPNPQRPTPPSLTPSPGKAQARVCVCYEIKAFLFSVTGIDVQISCLRLFT